jgi:dTDP-glucose 4,6-dehydratase
MGVRSLPGASSSSHLCELFLERGHEVICIDNFITGNPANIQHLIGREGFSFVKYDVTNYIHIDGPLDYVLHFASPASPIDYLEKPIQTLKVGSLGTHKTLGVAKDKGARYLIASTSGSMAIRSSTREEDYGAT